MARLARGAIHRDFGYLAVGFTVIYALSGHRDQPHQGLGSELHTRTERTLTIAPIPDDVSDDDAVKRVADATGIGDARRRSTAPATSSASTTRAARRSPRSATPGHRPGPRAPRFFLRVANWLHYNRGKKAWTYIADVYAMLLLYLAISGIFMIKGELGLRWRGAILIGRWHRGAGCAT